MDFETKDSGKRQEFESGMVRDTTEGKIKFDLVFDGPISGFSFLLNVLDPKSPEYELVSTFSVWYEMGGYEHAYKYLKLLANREGVFGFFERCAGLMTRGAVKYEAKNWMKATGYAERDRFRDSARRHFLQYMAGKLDEDHAAATWFNINGFEYVEERISHPF